MQWSPDAQLYFRKKDAGLTAKDIQLYYSETSLREVHKTQFLEKRELAQQLMRQLSAEYNFGPLGEEVFFLLFLYLDDEKFSCDFAKGFEETHRHPAVALEIAKLLREGIESMPSKTPALLKIFLCQNYGYVFSGDQIKKDPSQFQPATVRLKILLELKQNPELADLYNALLRNRYLFSDILRILESMPTLLKAFADPRYQDIFIKSLTVNDDPARILSFFNDNPEVLELLLELKQNPKLTDLYNALLQNRRLVDILRGRLRDTPALLNAFKDPEHQDLFIKILYNENAISIIFMTYPEALETLLELKENPELADLCDALIGSRYFLDILWRLRERPILLNAFKDPRYKDIFIKILSTNSKDTFIIFTKYPEALETLLELKQNSELADLCDVLLQNPWLIDIPSGLRQRPAVLNAFKNPRYKDIFIKILSTNSNAKSIIFKSYPDILEALLEFQQNPELTDLYNALLRNRHLIDILRGLRDTPALVNAFKDPEHQDLFIKILSNNNAMFIFTDCPEALETLLELKQNPELADLCDALLGNRHLADILRGLRQIPALLNAFKDPKHQAIFQLILKHEKVDELFGIVSKDPNLFLSLITTEEDANLLANLNDEDVKNILAIQTVQKEYFPAEKNHLGLTESLKLLNSHIDLPQNIPNADIPMVKAILLLIQKLAPEQLNEAMVIIKNDKLVPLEQYKSLFVLLHAIKNSNENLAISINFSSFLEDSTIEEWDKLILPKEDIDNTQWDALKTNIDALAGKFYDENTPGKESWMPGGRRQHIRGFLANSMNTSEAKASPEDAQIIRKRIAIIYQSINDLAAELEKVQNQLIEKSHDAELKSQEKKFRQHIDNLFDSFDAGGTTCPDRVRVYLTFAEIDIQLINNPEYLPNILVRLFKLNAIEMKLVDPLDKEAIEGYLYYEILFRYILGLEAKSKPERRMLHERIAEANGLVLPDAEAVLKVFQTFTAENLISFVAGHLFFKEKVKDKSNPVVNKAAEGAKPAQHYITKMNLFYDAGSAYDKLSPEQIQELIQTLEVTIKQTKTFKDIPDVKKAFKEILAKGNGDDYDQIEKAWTFYINSIRVKETDVKIAEQLLIDANFLATKK